MPTVLARQQLDDQAIFAVPPPAQHKPRVAPVHYHWPPGIGRTPRGTLVSPLSPTGGEGASHKLVAGALTRPAACAASHPLPQCERGALRLSCLSNIVVETHCGEAFGVFDPIVAHLYKEEQVHPALQHAFQFGAATGADLLDALALVTEHNGSLAGPADVDHLVDLDASVAPLLPG